MTSAPASASLGPPTAADVGRPVPVVARHQVSARLTEATPIGVQVGLDELGTPLADIEWVVVDLETTGLGASAAITEIGAVRVRAGRRPEEFHSLVDPEQPIPPRITALTGITSSMVRDAPPIDDAYPSFARWAGLEDQDGHAVPNPRPVLVAHNATFDTGFLRRSARRIGHDWPHVRVVDTLALARVALPRPLVPNHRLDTLAGHFNVSPTGRHRALDDARATVDVLHGLLALLEPLGAATLEDVAVVGAPVPARRRKRVDVADALPRTCGVYRFVDSSGDPLYVGSATNLRSRVRSYFTASESRARVRRMLDLVADVVVEPTSTLLEARVGELRAIRDLHPLFNAASTHQDDTRWLVRRADTLDVVPVVAQAEAETALGPFRSVRQADRTRTAVMTACSGPDGADADSLDAALRGHSGVVADALVERMAACSDVEDYEGAARWRESLAAYVIGLQRRQWVLPVASASRALWALHRPDGGWVLHAASWGRLTRTMVTPPGTSPAPWVDALLAEPALPRPQVCLARTTWEEARLLWTSLSGDGARLIHWEGDPHLAAPLDSPLSRTRLVSALVDARRM